MIEDGPTAKNEKSGSEDSPPKYADIYFDGEQSTALQIFQYAVGSAFGLVVITILAKAAEASGITRDTFLSRLEGTSPIMKALRAIVLTGSWIGYIIASVGDILWRLLVFLYESVNTKGKRATPQASTSYSTAEKAELGEGPKWDAWDDDGPKSSSVAPIIPTAKLPVKKGLKK